jgi:hypothetical protein
MANDPGDRFQSAAEVADLLQQYLAHRGQPATVPAPPMPVAPDAGDKPTAGGRTAVVASRLRPGIAATLLVAAAGLLVVGLSGGPSDDAVVQPAARDFDLRGPNIPGGLQVIGDDAGRCVRPEPQGLRVTISDDWVHPWGGVGVRSTVALSGNFEVTATYEILRADTPPSGYGVGASLRLQLADRSNDMAAVCRLVRPAGVPVVLWDRTVPGPGGKRRVQLGESPDAAPVGRLRLKRADGTLQYLWAPGTDGDEFQQIHACPVGPGDVQTVELTGLTGRQPCNLDLRFVRLRIRADAIEFAEADMPASGPRRKHWLAAGIVATLAVVLGLAVWVLSQRARRAGETAPRQTVDRGRLSSTPEDG